MTRSIYYLYRYGLRLFKKGFYLKALKCSQAILNLDKKTPQ